MTKEGTVLDGKYEILKEIGRGGMSIVYLAMDNRLNKQWAIKEIKNDGSKSIQTLLKGLEREANILRDVDHPVLPRIVDIINSHGTIYVVMDFIEGTNLADVLKEEGAQPQEDVIEWGKELASALDYLHSMDPPIIYRDMKPANVMLRPEGDVKLIDFGTAKEYTVESNADTTALGTRGYAAPEQFGDAQGRGIYKTDARTDIYNLGATMYHMVTGMNPCEPPYEIKPIRQWNPALSAGLEQIIQKCTQPNPEDRYQSCSELLYALDHYTELDDSYKKASKKKIYLFGAAVAVSILGMILAIIGNTGLQRAKKENYSTHIEAGRDQMVNGHYKAAADEYKSAFDINDADADAFVSYIDLYIRASQDDKAEGEDKLLLVDGLSTIANRINNSNSEVSSNSEVLYRLGLAYFSELSDYAAADKYFRMVDPSDPDYGELASYYESISFVLSGNNPDIAGLISKLNSFATYNQSRFDNTNEQKYVNYQIIGNLYTRYIASYVASQDEERVENRVQPIISAMTQAVTDLEEFTGENAQQYYYSFSNALSEIYYQLAAKGDFKNYYYLAINSSRDVANFASAKLTSASTAEGDAKPQAYRKGYEEKMIRIAKIYGAVGEIDNAVATFKEAESFLENKGSETQENLVRIYSEHLNFLVDLYSTDAESGEKNINNITKEQRREILDVYNAGSKIPGIDSDVNWMKRMNDVEKIQTLQNGTAGKEEG